MNKVILVGRLTKDPEVRYEAGNGFMNIPEGIDEELPF